MSVSRPITQDVLFFFGDKTWELELYEKLVERLADTLPEMTARAREAGDAAVTMRS